MTYLLTKYHLAALATATLVWLVCAAGIPQLRYVSDYRMFFGEDNTELGTFAAIEQYFDAMDADIFVVSATRDDLFSNEHHAVLESLTDDLRQTPWLQQLVGITTIPLPTAGSDDTAAARRQAALASPLAPGLLLSADARVTAYLVTTAPPGENDVTEMAAIVGHLRALRDDINDTHSTLEARIAGVTVYNNAILEVAVKDLLLLFPLSSLLVLGLLYLSLRCWRSTLAIAWTVVYATTAITGLCGWLGIQTNPASVMIPVAVLVMSIAHGVHIQNSLLGYRARHPDSSMLDALQAALAQNLFPTFLTSLTTALGFLTLNFSDSPPYQQLGSMVALGVMLGWLFSLLILPGANLLLPIPLRGSAGTFNPMARRLAGWIAARPGTAAVTGAAPLIVLMAFAPQNRLNDNLVQWFDDRVPVRQAADYADRKLTGIFQIHYLLQPAAGGHINDPVFIRQVAAFADWYREQPGVTNVRSIVDLMRQANAAFGSATTPADARAIDEALMMIRMASPDRGLIRQFVAPGQSALLLSVVLRNSLGTRELLIHDAAARQWLEQNASTVIPVNGTSPTIMFAHIVERNSRSMLLAAICSLAGISVILLLVLRSWRLGLLSLVPNLMPIAAGFGIWAILSGQVGIAISAVAGAVLGIVIDDSIHFLARYRRLLAQHDMTRVTAMQRTLTEVGPALVTTSLAAGVGFLVIAMSGYQPNQQIGVMFGIIIALALYAVLLLLPALLLLTSRDQS